MINIAYDENNHSAIISSDKSSNQITWTRIRRIIEDSAEISKINKEYEIIIPWWCFLSIRSTLVNALKIHSQKFEVTRSAEYYLNVAIAHEKKFVHSNSMKILPKEQIEDQLLEKGFTRILTTHQLRNVQRMLNFPAAATFSVPGAGKTSEALAYYILKRNVGEKILVVSPRNAFASWEEEVVNCIPVLTPSLIRLQGTHNIERLLESNNDGFLITYQQFYRVDSLIADFLKTNQCFMILDESHRIKRGYKGVYGSSILSVCHLPKYKLIMSGTPLPNAIDDLIPQLTYLYPEIYVDSENVVSRISPLYVRTTKDELGIKPAIRKNWAFDMKPAQRTLYDNIISETRRTLDGMRLSNRILFNEVSKCIIRLIQVTTDPILLINTELGKNELVINAIGEGPGRKVEEACHIARHLANEGQKTIIWTQFVNTVESIADLLSDLNAEFIHGSVETDEDESNWDSRESVIKRFHDDDEFMALVANPAACAEGISLHKVCHNAIYVDRNYNAAHYLQSEDRIHRLGLSPDQDTNIHILTCNYSIDQSIGKRLELKIHRMGAVLNDRGLTIEPIQMVDESTGLTFEDIEDFQRLILGE